jgi:gliding motility-associated-like protein
MIPDGNISFTGTGDNRELIFTSLPGQNGEVIITLTADDGQASANTSTATVTITLEDTEPPVAICQNAIVQLNPQGVGSVTASEIDDGSTDNCQLGVFSLSQTQFSCADVGIRTVTLTVNDAVGNASTCESEVTVLPPPVQLSLSAFQYAGGFEISCSGASDGTVTALPSEGCAPYTFEWVEIPGFSGETASQLPAGSYTVILTDAAGQNVARQITLEEPTALQNISSSQDVTCFGKADGRIDLAVQGGVPPYAFSAGPQIAGLPQGNYTYSATDANGCAVSMNFTIQQPQEIVLNVLPLVSVQCGEQIPLVAEAFNGTGEYTYHWNGPGIDCPNCATTYAMASQTVIYDVTVTDENGCSKTGQTRAEVSCNMYIPNAFTPGNGDMLNPEFRVYSGDLERFSFTIFDRWGQRIYASSNPTEGWDGRIKNKPAPQGIYVYRLSYKFPGGKENEMMGSFVLLTGE